MILVDEVRINNRGHHFELNKFETTPVDALRRLYAVELDFGGRITKLTDTEVTVQTPVLGQTDISTYSGDPTEMVIIVKAATIHSAILRGIEPSELVDALYQVLGDQAGNPLLFTNFMPLILGGGSSRLSFCLLMGIDPASDQAKNASLNDFLDILVMAEADGLSFIEVFDLLVPA